LFIFFYSFFSAIFLVVSLAVAVALFRPPDILCWNILLCMQNVQSFVVVDVLPVLLLLFEVRVASLNTGVIYAATATVEAA